MTPPDPNTIENYLSGKCTEPEKNQVEEWLKTQENNDVARQFDSDKLEELKHKNWERLQVDIRKTKRPRFELSLKIVLRVAAIFIIIASSVAAIYYLQSPSQQPEIAKAKLLQQTNNTAGIRIVKLADGSSVSLQPGASLKYRAGFNVDKREVWLEGTAFFQIAHDTAHPFYVYSSELTTQVVGTSFWVKSGNKPQVEVKTGKVAVYKNSETKEKAVYVMRNEKATLENNTLTASIVDQPVVNENEQTKSTFIFKDVPLTNVFATLRKEYGVEIFIANDTLAQRKFTGNLTGLDFHKQLKIICSSVKAQYETKETKIIIYLN